MLIPATWKAFLSSPGLGQLTAGKHAPSRRSVIKAGAVSTALSVTGAAAVSASPAIASSGTHVLAGIGPDTTTYSPPVTGAVGTVTMGAKAIFAPGLATSVPGLLAVGNSLQGTINTSCTGEVTVDNVTGTVSWSDGTASLYPVRATTVERVQGHAVGRVTATVTSGHFTGATVDLLLLKLAGSLTACLTGGGFTNSAGYEILILTME